MKEQVNSDKPELLAALDTWEKLGEYWMKRPYLRLGQIVSNAWQIHPDYKRNPEPDIQDIFYLSDKKLVEGLELLRANESKDSRSA
jgi:hypothetical protein